MIAHRRPYRPGWYRRASLRARMTMLTAVVVTVVVGTGGILIGISVRGELIDAADEAAGSWVQDVVGRVEAGKLPAELPAVADDEDAAVQVVSADRVLSSTPNLSGAAPLGLPLQPVGATAIYDFQGNPLTETGPYRVAARGVASPVGTVTIFVAIPVEDVYETVRSATRVGTIGLALLVLALCAAMWVVIGRTLRPVESIRRRTEAISGRHLHRRVPEPDRDDEIGRLARTVNAMLARLEDSAGRQRRFVADAAHELRNPISSLRAQLETARARAGNGFDSGGQDLLTETMRMQRLVEQLLVLARSDGGSLPPGRCAVDLDDTVEAAVTARPVDPKVSVDLSYLRPVQVTGHAEMLDLVVRNLLDNATRYAASRVEVGLSAPGDGSAVLTVDDDGPGVPEDRRGEIFQRFSRLDHARVRNGGGVGLGLAIVDDIVASHDGTVDVSHSPLGGARFRVRLPCHLEGIDIPVAGATAMSIRSAGPAS